MEEFYILIAGIVLFAILICLTIVWLLSVCGILQSVEVGAGPPPIGEVVFAYKFARGPYKNAGELFGEIYRIVPESRCLGIYYDDPKVIPREKLRYAVGAIMGEGGVKIEKEEETRLESEGLKILRLPAVAHCVKTSFPYISVLSIPIAVWKVYPALARYIKDHRLCAYPFLEIYEPDVINFMAPLSKQEDFFVPESKECVPDEYRNDADDSFIDTTRGSPSLYESDFSDSSRSRSVSEFSSKSRSMFETFSKDDSDDEDMSRRTPSDLQDTDISSTIEVRESKACTNLLEDQMPEEPVVDTSVVNNSQVIAEAKDSSDVTEDDIEASLQDSGICSGRTSTVPAETSTDSRIAAEVEGEDSSSSFEEIHVDESMNLCTGSLKASED